MEMFIEGIGWVYVENYSDMVSWIIFSSKTSKSI